MTPFESHAPAAIPQPETFPVKPGDWISTESGRVAKVKGIYRVGGALCVDLWIYGDKGERIGRESPVCGGPRTFEPACDWEGWFRIDEPAFPVRFKWVPDGKGKVTAQKVAGKRLPDRAWLRPVRRPQAVPAAAPVQSTNLDAMTQARARRIAAEEMRDVARTLGRGEAEELLRARRQGAGRRG